MSVLSSRNQSTSNIYKAYCFAFLNLINILNKQKSQEA